MASICLSREEVEDEDLPFVCMRCGEPATVCRHKTFFPIFLCNRHKNPRLMSSIAIGLGLAVFFMGMSLFAFVYVELEEAITTASGAGTILSVLPLLALLVVFFEFVAIVVAVFVLILGRTLVRAKAISKDSVIVAGVSEEFVARVVAFRRHVRSEQETNASHDLCGGDSSP